MLGLGDLGVTLAYVLMLLSVVLCIYFGIRHWNDREEMPTPQHPPGEDLEFEDEV